MIRTWTAYLLWAVAAAPAASVDPAKVLENADAAVDRAMWALHAPGVAVGIIQDGKVILAKGYGVRRLNETAAVTADTLFAVGSMTKSFTAVTVAVMVDEKKLEWDQPVREYLPWFRMYDPVATELMTPRDLLTHRSGLPRHDFIRFSTPLTRAELVRRLRYLEPNRTFRDVYQYNNLMYVTAGFLAGEVAGTTWEELVKSRIYKPLAMDRSNTSTAETRKQDNFAWPHVTIGGAVQSTEFYDYQKFGVGPNGAVNSTVNDMLKYLDFHLSNGTVNGRRLISQAQMLELHKPVTVTGPGGYALGWNVYSRAGHKVWEHGGSITGFTSMMILLPEERAGVVVLNNLDSRLPAAVAWDLAENLLGLPRSGKLPAAPAGRPSKVRDSAAPKPTLQLAEYTGTYFHPAYGTIRVEAEDGGLAALFGAAKVLLKPYRYDTFECESQFVSGLAQFHLNGAGKASELLLPLEPAVKPFVFVKR
ncbi:MAG TPA: serine hydrolase [Bryobacteraceae bacterium]|nr:serine hydrolase [Bryobacteraceae bacterium]